MFALNYYIDSFQNGKKFFVNSFVTDQKSRDALNAFVDAQTDFTKQIIKTGEVLAMECATNIERAFTPAKTK